MRVGSVALWAGVALAKTLSAASYPTRRIRIMVGSPLAEASIRSPHARAAPHTLLGVSVIVTNRPGAGGTIATDLIADDPNVAHREVHCQQRHSCTMPTRKRIAAVRVSCDARVVLGWHVRLQPR